MFYDEKRINMLRQRYPAGTRICLDSMENDPQPIPSGTMGTVVVVDDMGQLVMKWDNGRSLSLIPGEDDFHVIQPEKNLQMKPDCPLIGANGNIFHLMGIASRTLEESGMAEEAKEMCSKITQSGSYDKALSILGEYVNITSIDEEMNEYEDYEQESETGMNMTM